MDKNRLKNATKGECLYALATAHKDPDAAELIELLINDYFSMIDHMKKTSLYDVYMYEENFAKNSVEPMKLLCFENEKLKKEVNKLRKQLGLCNKYKESKGEKENG